MIMTATVRDARPPANLVWVLNPIMRIVLRTPLGRLVRPFALVEFSGRRSGRRYRIPVGWHETEGGALVITPASWRINFVEGLAASIRYRGRRQSMIGTLNTDPAAVADALQSLFDSGTAPRNIGLDMPADHRITASDVTGVGRAMIRFTA